MVIKTRVFESNHSGFRPTEYLIEEVTDENTTATAVVFKVSVHEVDFLVKSTISIPLGRDRPQLSNRWMPYLALDFLPKPSAARACDEVFLLLGCPVTSQ
jgi:hypothetical protein